MYVLFKSMNSVSRLSEKTIRRLSNSGEATHSKCFRRVVPERLRGGDEVDAQPSRQQAVSARNRDLPESRMTLEMFPPAEWS